MLRNAIGGGGVSFPRKKRYEGVRFNIISVTRGWVGGKSPGKKRYVTLEWPLNRNITPMDANHTSTSPPGYMSCLLAQH